jgi:hypothetical protein
VRKRVHILREECTDVVMEGWLLTWTASNVNSPKHHCEWSADFFPRQGDLIPSRLKHFQPQGSRSWPLGVAGYCGSENYLLMSTDGLHVTLGSLSKDFSWRFHLSSGSRLLQHWDFPLPSSCSWISWSHSSSKVLVQNLFLLLFPLSMVLD